MSKPTPSNAIEKIKWGRSAIIGFVVVGIAALLTAWALTVVASDRGGHADTPKIHTLEYKLDIADTAEERVLGLSGRERLAHDEAMLFVFEQAGEYCFWMKDMNFPIDMIWLDRDKKIVHVQKNATPESFPNEFCPGASARYVLEVNAEASDELGLRVGDRVRLSQY